ncbi:hypothetical protein SAMN05216600_10527 [Pseudomonas cuatrocienegasensis]|uniref:O-Antigen ligase n=1 Tax=Pseudomonas cuatrocienegasensis TaxID=543360 RepID=A0ABY1B9S2_9PSED|nr:MULTISPECIES: hypothetical protein [Pseudomonas]SEQ32018.1 hypothetical protein SAMN05216600_10527 [Pseudomonas cuatrocienegasensis]
MSIVSDFSWHSKATYFTLACLCLLSLNPFIIWSFSVEIRAAVLLSLLVMLVLKCKFSVVNIMIGSLLGSCTFLYFYLFGNSFLGCMYSAAFIFLLLQYDAHLLSKTFTLFKYFFVFSLIPGGLLWVYHHITGDYQAFSVGSIEPLMSEVKSEKNQLYTVYPLSIVLDHMLVGSGYRLFGVYDEPGVVGTFSALFLAADKFNFKKIENLLIFVFGVISFSLAFYVLVAISCLMYSFKKPFFFLCALISLISIPFFAQFEIFEQRVLSRFEVTANGISGDNRSSVNLDNEFDKWMSSSARPLILGEADYEKTGDSSWKQIPLRVGLLGTLFFFIILGAVFFFHVRKIDYYGLVFLLIFFASIYQRPNVITPAYLIIFLFPFLNYIRCTTFSEKET